MATEQNKYLTQPKDVTALGLQNILNAGSEGGEGTFQYRDDTQALSVTGQETSGIPAILAETELGANTTTGGVNALQAEQQAANTNYAQQYEKLGKLASNSKELLNEKDFYNESGVIPGAISNIASATTMARKAVQDVVSVGVLKGGYINSVANSLAEETWRAGARYAKDNEDKSYETFATKMGVYSETEGVGGFDKSSMFIDFSSLNADPETFAQLKLNSIKVREDDGTFRDPNTEEMAWFEKYRNLMRTRIAEKSTQNLQNFFNEEIASYSPWLDEYMDTRGNKYTTARNVSNILGSAVGSAVLFELAAAPAGAINFAGQVFRAKSVVKAVNTANKAWRGSVLTNPYFLSKGGGVLASGTGGVATFTTAFMQQFTETKAQALAAGWDPVTAGRIAAKNAGAQAIVEGIGYERFLHKYLMGGRGFDSFFMNAMLPEGGEEVMQTGIDTYFTNKYGMDYTTMKELAGNMWWSFVGGAGGAIGIGAIHTMTNVGGAVADYNKFRKSEQQYSDPKVNTEDWLKKNGYDPKKGTVESAGVVAPSEGALAKFKEFVDQQKEQSENAQVAATGNTENATAQLPYNINYDWAPTVINSLPKSQKLSFDEFCEEHNVDANNHEELREALLMWTGNENFQVIDNPESEDPQMDRAVAELNAVMKTIASKDFEMEPPTATQERLQNEKEQILAAVKEDVTRRAKQENPKITKAQLEAAWSAVSKIIENDLDSGELTVAIANEAMEDVAIVMQDAKVAQATKEVSIKAAKNTQNVIDVTALRKALTSEGTEKYDAQWDVAQQIFENQVVRAFGDRDLAKALSTLARKTYYNSLSATPEVNPVTFMSKLAPDFVTPAALRRHNIQIAGLQSLDSKMQHLGLKDSINYAKTVNAILAQQIEQYKNMEDGQEKNELAASILYGLFGEDSAKIKIEDALKFIDEVAREEMRIHKHIGSGKLVANLSESDFTLMALLRLRGASETEILYAMGVLNSKTEVDYEAYYNNAVEALYPRPSQSQLASLEMLGHRLGKAGQEKDEAEGRYFTNEQGGRPLILVNETDAPGLVVTHEMVHWIEDISKQVGEFADNEALMALGQKQAMSLGNTSDNNLPFSNRNIASLYTRIREVLINREDMKDITSREIAETVADFLTRYLRTYQNIDPELAAAFQSIYSVSDAKNADIVGSMYNKLTQKQKSDIREIFDETFDTHVLNHAHLQIQEADGLRKALLTALSKVDKMSTTEAPAYQLYKNLVGYLSSRPKKSAEINRGISRMAKAYAAFKEDSNEARLKGAIVYTALETINKLEEDGQKAMVDLMYEQAETAEDPNFMSDAQRRAIKEVNEAADEAEEAEFILGEDEEGNDWLDRVLIRNDEKEADEEPYAFKRQKDTRTATEKMRGALTLKEGLRETFRNFRWGRFKEAFNSVTASVVEYANKIHPALGAAVQAVAYETDGMKSYNAEIKARWYNTFKEYNEWAEANGKEVITNAEFETYKNLLINHKRSVAFARMEKRFADNPKLQNQLHGMHAIIAARLDESYKLMLQMGFQLEEVKDYFPSIVNDREGYAMKVYMDLLAAEEATGKKIMPEWQRKLKGKYETEVRKAVRKTIEKFQKANKEIDMVDVVNAVNAELGHPKDKFSAPHVYRVQNMLKDQSFNSFYMDVFDAFNTYTNDIANKFFNYRLVGKTKWVRDENDNKKISKDSGIIGAMMTGLQFTDVEGYNYDEKAEEAFAKALEQTLSRKDQGDDIFTTFKQLQTYMTLGRLTSAFNQFLELGPTMMRYGLVPTIKSMFQALSKDNPLTINTLGIQPLNEAERLDTNGLLGKLNSFMLNINGFTKADILMKNTVIIATMANAQQMLARDEEYGNENETYGQRRFHRAFLETFPSPVYNDAQRAQIKADLKEGNLTPEVKLFLRNSLAATQPIDLAEVPALYNSLGNMGRSLYFLSVVSIKQMRFMWDQFVKDFRNGGVKDAAINMSRFLWFACLAGVPPDWLKDIVHGKQPNIRETAFYSPLQYLMVNKYFTSVLKDKGVSSAVGIRFTVGLQFFDDLARAAINKEPWYLARAIPGAGELLDHWYGVAHKQAVRHKENLNKYEPISTQLIKRPLKKDFEFFGWKL